MKDALAMKNMSMERVLVPLCVVSLVYSHPVKAGHEE